MVSFSLSSRLFRLRNLRNGPWMIRGIPIFLNKWSPETNLLKEGLSCVPAWVKFHDVPVVAYTSDGLSLIAYKIGTLCFLTRILIILLVCFES